MKLKKKQKKNSVFILILWNKYFKLRYFPADRRLFWPWREVKGTGVCRAAPLSSCVTDRTPLSLSLQGVYESDLSSIYLSPLPLYFYRPCFLLSPTLLQLSPLHFHLSIASRHSWFRHLFTHSHQPLKTHLMHQFPQYSSSILISLILSHWVFLV